MKNRLWAYDDSDVTERVAVHICSATRKITCRTFDVKDPKSTAKPADWKYQSSALSFLTVECNVCVDLKIPISSLSSSHRDQQISTRTGLAKWAKELDDAVILFNGQFKDKDGDLLDDPKKSRSAGHSSSQVIKASILKPATVSADSRSTALVQACKSSLSVQGVVKCRAYIQSNKPKVKEALQAIKRDILNTVSDRCEILFEDIVLNGAQNESETSATPLPQRVFVPVSGSSVMLCDYVFGDESAEDLQNRFAEMLDQDVRPDGIEFAEERTCGTRPDENQDPDAACHCDPDAQPKENLTPSKIQQNLGSKIWAMSGTYKHKSGATKRKLSRQRRENEASTSKIDTFFGKKSEVPKKDAPVEITDEPMESVPEEVILDPEAESSVEMCPPNKEDTLEPLPAKMPSCLERTPLTEEGYFHYGQDLHKAGITMEMFWDFHPKQPKDNIPFNDNVVYYRKGIQGSNVHRRWVTFNEKTTSVHCSICLFYGPEKYKQTQLIQGCSDWRHITTRLMEHENSQCHKQASDTYFINMKGKFIKHKLLSTPMTLRNQQVLQRRSIVSHIIDIVFSIGVQALPYRSGQVESVAKVFDEDHLENRGNFLETMKLLADYSPVLKEHLTNVIQKAKTRDPSTKGRGKFVSFLSKSTINKLFSIIGDMLKEEIVKEVENSGLFSIQMDSTQDVSAHDQCAIVVRYVAGEKVKERLLRLVTVEDSSSKNLHALLRESLSATGLNLEKCIGDSFDGAANMSGTYTGLQALMKEVRPTHIHTWCYAHVLNLVIGDASTVCVPAVSLFGLLSNLSTFFNESYKRMKLWEDHMRGKTGSSKLKKLERIGKTRWSSRARALRKIFGSFDDHSNELCSDLVLILKEVSESTDFRTSVRHEALKLCENLCKFETILAAFTFIRVFDITTPVSDYLQTTGLDFIQAWRMVDDAVMRLNKICRDFAGVFQSASTFIDNMNEKLAGDNIHLNKSLPELRSTRTAEGTDNRKNFEISCHNVILDKVLESVKSRFFTHGELYKQISCLDPNRFEEILASSDKIQLNVISDAVTDIDPVALREELLSFASSYKNIRKGLLDESDEEESEAWDSDLEEQDPSSSSEPSTSTPAVKKDSCKNCVSCAFKLLYQYRLCSVAFENLFLAYKYLLTLSTTQCTCERSFSKLKILKSRLRSSLSQQNLEPLMLIAVEKQVALKLKSDKDKIIDRFAKTSPELSSLLLL